ncbi:hypothetical protein ACTMNS_05320, partial [Staphylococcus haemolyticus]
MLTSLVIQADLNPKPNNLDRRFRIYRETLSRFSCAASTTVFTVCQQFYSVEMSAMISFLVGAIIYDTWTYIAFILIPKNVKA